MIMTVVNGIKKNKVIKKTRPFTILIKENIKRYHPHHYQQVLTKDKG